MNIAIIGCGNMGSALAKQLAPFHQVFLADRSKQKAQTIASNIHALAFDSPLEAIKDARYIFIAVKPHDLTALSKQINSHLSQHQIILSVLGGTPLAVLQDSFPNRTVFRTMPNLAIQCGAGTIGIALTEKLSNEMKDEISQLVTPLGTVVWIKERLMDSLTVVTGSGPAFMLNLIEAMTEAGIAMGFSSREAKDLVIQMIQGSLALLQSSGQHPAELKWQIASPNGITIEGLRVMEREKMKSGMIETLLAALQKARNMNNS